MAGRGKASPDIRFADVAHYVGLSLTKDPSVRQSKSSVRLNPLKTQESVASSAASPTLSRDEQQRNDKLKTQLEWLRAEQRAEKEQLKRLESSLSDSMLLEKKAHRRAEKHREMRDFHQRQAAEVNKKIDTLQQEMKASLKTKVLLEPVKADDASSSRGMSAAGADGPEHGRRLSAQERSDAFLNSRLSASPPASSPAAPSRQQEDVPDVAGDENITLKEYFDAADMREREKQSTANASMSGLSQTESSVRNKSASMKRSQSTSSHMLHRPPQLTDEEIAQNHEMYRDTIRCKLLESAGGPKQAFRAMDLNGSGNISLQEFADGVSRAGINWQEITQMRRPRELFKIFDLDKDGVITLPELFPEMEEKEPERVSTPEFWNRWTKRNKDFQHGLRDPMWHSNDPEAELQLLFSNSQSHDEAGEQRKWMAATIRRLKNRGKSDARCREIVAGHLPRGTGPKDREDVQTFSAQEVKFCRQTYKNQVNDPVRNIQKVVYDMREQRRVLHDFRQKLWTVTMEPMMRKQMEDDHRKSVGLGLTGPGGLTGSVAKDPDAGPPGPVKRSMKSIAQECGMSDESIEDLAKEYMPLADKSEMLNKKGFGKLLSLLCPGRTIAESDSEAWWEQIMKAMPASADDGRKGLACDFERFAIWYSTSEARS